MAEQLNNPFENATGGGLLTGICVVVGSKTHIKPMARGDGSAVLDDKTHEQILKNFWTITVVPENSEQEFHFDYSLGGLLPTADGKSFIKWDGTPAVGINRNTHAWKFSEALKAAGFDRSLLFVNGKPDVTGIIGARITFKGEDRLDKNGDVKLNAKNFPMQDYFPVEFHGFKESVRHKGNGVDDATKTKATEAVMGVLAEAGGSLNQVELVKALSKKMAGNADLPAIVGLVSKREVPGVKVEGAIFSL